MESKNQRPSVLRRKYIINPKFQYFMIGFALFQSAATIGALYVMNTFSFQRFNALGIEAGIPSDHIYFQFLHQQHDFFNQAMLVTSVVIGIAILASVTLISHRIAGPIYRLTQHMLNLSEGKELHEIQFRKKDFFPEIPEVFNLMVFKMKQKGLSVKEEKKGKGEAA